MMLDVTLDPQASGADRLAAWQDVMAASGVVHVADADDLAGTFRSRELGAMRTMRVTATTFRLVRDRTKAAGVALDHVLVNLVEAGGFEGRLAGRRLVARPGDLVLSRLGSLMDLVLRDADWLALVLPQKLVERHMRWEGRLDGTVHTAGSVAAGVVGGLVRSVCALPDPLPPREVARATRCALATLAACLGEARTPGRGPGPGDGEAVSARSVRRFIAMRLSDPALNVEMIRREFGLSRSALYRVMAADTADIAATIRTLRLHAIAQDIASPGGRALPLAEIAARHGMDDQRSFRRAFAREFGHSPSLLRDGDAPAPAPRSPGTLLQQWFSGS